MVKFFDALKFEYRLYKKYPILFGAFCILTLVPSLYATIYLSSIWDPYSNLKSLPVCFTNADKGTEFRGQQIKLGAEVEKTLKDRNDFLYQDQASKEDIQKQIAKGDCYFGVIIPENFSQLALVGRSEQQAKLEVFLSEGNSFMASMIGKKFGSELTHKLNETLNKKRWEVLLDKLESSSVGLKNLKQGAFQLRDGAKKLDDGSGILAQKNAELSAGLEKIQSGARKIKEGTNKLKTESAKIPIFGEKVSNGAGQIEGGLDQLIAGLVQATDGSKKLTQGAEQVHDGLGKVYAGLDLMYSKIPAKVDLPEGDAEGMAASISMDAKISDIVQKNGIAFAPYFTALSLWVGAIMLTFIFQLQHLPQSVVELSQFKKLATKIGLALPILMAQSLLITLSMAYVLDIQLQHPFTFWLIAFCGSLTFFTIVLTLITSLGDVGRVVALIFLIFQLGAAGGAFPVELSGGIFAQAHSYLPITDVVKALRAVLFGTYNGEWYWFLAKLLSIALFVFILAWIFGRRWRYIHDEDYKPAINV
ncbi:hypothetical protein CIK05_06095 [Bdellovibrio sp. qaytius]|nr:hypothetical protein CIK05_06095 [Bdellovibrio sp. qaytius]